MRTARGARIRSILGASLIATTLPLTAVAEKSDSTTSAISGGSSQAISGGSVSGISGGSTAAISGGSATAISGGSVDAISGGSAAAISGGSVDAISGGSAAAISGGSVDAISGGSGGSAAAISGGSVDAISGGSAAAISGGSVDAISGGSAAAISGGTPLLAGPVDSIDWRDGSFTSVGQTVTFAGERFGSLRVGDFVTVSGSIAGAGIISADYVEVSGEPYVPGATEVFVTGVPSSVDYGLGTARIGNLTVDYTPSLGGAGFGGIGAAVSVIGIQPARGGIMLSDRVFDKTDLFLRD
jgi:hypothetical protein